MVAKNSSGKILTTGYTFTFKTLTNSPPTLSSIADMSINEDEPLVLPLLATDTGTQPLVFSASSDTSVITTQMIGDTLRLTPVENWNGSSLITVYVSDGELQDTTTFALTVIPVNDAPVVAVIANVFVYEDSLTTILLSATDIEGDAFTFSAFSDTSAVETEVIGDTLRLTPLENWNGSATITVFASDDESQDSKSFSLTVNPVNDPPGVFNLVSPVDKAVVEINDQTINDTLTISWESSVDVDGDTLTYLWVSMGDLDSLNFPEITENELKIVYSDIYAIMDQSYLSHWTDPSNISGTWIVQASDGKITIEAENGPFNLTVNENVLSIEDDNLIPEAYTLHQNFPNPFNPVTTIQYDLPERSDVLLTIYDILGRQVRTLVRGVEEPGYRSIVWDGSDDFGGPVSTGVYLYQIKAGDFTQTRKMLLLR